MGKSILSFMLLVSMWSWPAYANSEIPLDDLMSPDEIAEEAGFPRTEMTEIPVIKNFEEINEVDGVSLINSFAIVLIINKRAAGPGAQTMQVYENGALTAVWPVSTGRENWEFAKSGRYYFTTTPKGYYYPKTIKRIHWSNTWDAKMEYAVFFNGGVAVHATTPDHYKQLGTRASGGCVRLHLDNAAYIYNRILAEGKGLVPRVGRDGTIKRDRRGTPQYFTNWKTLIAVVE
ncbi:L,D-transpeptidase [Bdellovibrio sp. HCB2-146]|uniref:L,D-transpeptidase n=1 Tax=Bdellovibrio sp. HCB2-146 TaxID=3394362 RepID=UPI0039BCF2C9